MVGLEYLSSFYRGKKVFLTGHTGFKGTWLLQTLAKLGAVIKGYALAPEHPADLYHQVHGDQFCRTSILHDLRDAERLRREILHFEPDYIFHLAAQPLVMRGYAEPLYTFEVNTQGTANVLDALRYLDKDCATVMITTDKVYENHDEGRAFREDDKLGGHDPYSASKAACELIIDAYRRSFFDPAKSHAWQKPLASARAGNVIGGGDFAENRLVPDIVKAILNEQTIVLRHPESTRPWQHVLEPLGAYLLLGARLAELPKSFSMAYNIGPDEGDVLTVEELTRLAIESAGKGQYVVKPDVHAPKEAATLMLNTDRVRQHLHWRPVYNSKEAVMKTMDWYLDSADAALKCKAQIDDYFQAAASFMNPKA